MNEEADEKLMKQFQEGDSQALSILYERYKSRILNFCLRILGNRSDAEDVTGNVFLAFFSGKYQPRLDARFSTWLFTVARNRCFDILRSRKGDISAEVIALADHRPVPSAGLEHKERAMRIREAIGQLPDEQREAMILRSYHGFSYAQIADVLHCSVDKVKVLLFRAREQLRGEMNSFLKEDQ